MKKLFVFSILILGFSFSNNASEIDLPEAQNLQADSQLHQSSGRVILLYVSSPDCAFCARLEEEVIGPLIKSGEYNNKIILRNMIWESSVPVINFSGEKQLPVDFLLAYKIVATPTLLFLNGDGTEVAKGITGYQGDDFYWYYLDLAIEQANDSIRL